MLMSDFSDAFMSGLYVFHFPRPILILQGYTWDLPVPAHEIYAHATGLWLRGVKQVLALTHCSYCLPHRPTRSALPKGDFGAQYCAYASPTNASPPHRWKSRHSSGSEWIANPFSVKDLTSFSTWSLTFYLMRVLTGAFRMSLFHIFPLFTLPYIGTT